jgi:hypothetical protein
MIQPTKPRKRPSQKPAVARPFGAPMARPTRAPTVRLIRNTTTTTVTAVYLSLSRCFGAHIVNTIVVSSHSPCWHLVRLCRCAVPTRPYRASGEGHFPATGQASDRLSPETPARCEQSDHRPVHVKSHPVRPASISHRNLPGGASHRAQPPLEPERASIARRAFPTCTELACAAAHWVLLSEALVGLPEQAPDYEVCALSSSIAPGRAIASRAEYVRPRPLAAIRPRFECRARQATLVG